MGRQGGGGRGHKVGEESVTSGQGWDGVGWQLLKQISQTEDDLPVSMPLRACSRGPGRGKDTDKCRVADARRRPGRPARPGVRRPRPRLRSGLRACPPASFTSAPPAWPLRPPLVLSSALRAARLPGPASRASQARLRQSWLRSGPGDCGDGSGEGGDLAGRRRRWRPRPCRSHLDNQPTPRPSRRKPGGTRGGAAGGSGQ